MGPYLCRFHDPILILCVNDVWIVVVVTFAGRKQIGGLRHPCMSLTGGYSVPPLQKSGDGGEYCGQLIVVVVVDSSIGGRVGNGCMVDVEVVGAVWLSSMHPAIMAARSKNKMTFNLEVLCRW